MIWPLFALPMAARLFLRRRQGAGPTRLRVVAAVPAVGRGLDHLAALVVPVRVRVEGQQRLLGHRVLPLTCTTSRHRRNCRPSGSSAGCRTCGWSPWPVAGWACSTRTAASPPPSSGSFPTGWARTRCSSSWPTRASPRSRRSSGFPVGRPTAPYDFTSPRGGRCTPCSSRSSLCRGSSRPTGHDAPEPT